MSLSESFRWIAVLWVAGCGPAVQAGSSGSTGAQSTTSASTHSTDSTTVQGSVGGATGSASTTTPIPPGTTGFASTGEQTDTTTDDSGRDFITKPDGGSGAPECSVWSGKWCAPGEGCKPWANDRGTVWNATRCAPIPGDPDLVGQPCATKGNPLSGIDSCEARAMCFRVDPKSLQGICVAYCSGDADNPSCAEPDNTCVVGNGHAIAVCLPSCDPLLQNCVGEDMCTGNYGEETGFFCIPSGTPYINDASVQPAACSVGQVGVLPDLVDGCVGDGPCCTDFCDLAEVDACTDGLSCTPWVPKGTCPGACEEGLCLSPS